MGWMRNVRLDKTVPGAHQGVGRGARGGASRMAPLGGDTPICETITYQEKRRIAFSLIGRGLFDVFPKF